MYATTQSTTDFLLLSLFGGTGEADVGSWPMDAFVGGVGTEGVGSWPGAEGAVAEALTLGVSWAKRWDPGTRSTRCPGNEEEGELSARKGGEEGDVFTSPFSAVPTGLR